MEGFRKYIVCINPKKIIENRILIAKTLKYYPWYFPTYFQVGKRTQHLE